MERTAVRACLRKPFGSTRRKVLAIMQSQRIRPQQKVKTQPSRADRNLRERTDDPKLKLCR